VEFDPSGAAGLIKENMMALDDTFYFVIHPAGDRSAVKVIDLSNSVSYERSEWLAVNDRDFTDRDEAIEHARGLAKKYGLNYVPFESRYNSELNEPYSLELDEPLNLTLD
jgi:hypothetical protein